MERAGIEHVVVRGRALRESTRPEARGRDERAQVVDPRSSNAVQRFAMLCTLALALVLGGAALAEHAVTDGATSLRTYAALALAAGVVVFVAARLELRARLAALAVERGESVERAEAVAERVARTITDRTAP